MRYLKFCVALLVLSCQPAGEHGHEEGGHAHDSEGASVDYTLWTEKTELFVEFPVLVAGQTSRFVAHFTKLNGHKPVLEGAVTVSLIKDNKGIRQTAENPSSPGIFTPSLQPKEAGVHQLIFGLKTSDYSDRIVIEDIQVYATKDEAENAISPEEDDGAISFLKEQAWKMEFQTALVVEKELYEVISTSGRWKVAPADSRALVAPTSGKVTFIKNNLVEGREVRKGELLLSIDSEGLTSNNLRTEIRKAKATLDQAEAAFRRKKKLNESKIVPSSELEKAKEKYETAQAEYEALSSGYSSRGKQVVSPFNGYIKSIAITNGGFADQGAELVSITSHKSSLLEAEVSSSFSNKLSNIENIWYQTNTDNWSSLKDSGGKVLSVGREVERDKPLLSVFAQVNEAIEMPEGSFTEVQLAVGKPIKKTVIPVSALLEDYGNYSVIVQLSGESFERRNIQIGSRNGSEVEVISGLIPGEVVVTKGAYQVKMASMSGQAPAHGHAH